MEKEGYFCLEINSIRRGLYKIQVEITADGSHTLFIPEMDEHYHSVNGAIQESHHVFIHSGLHAVSKTEVRVLEIGFGTGLNALLTWKDAECSGRYSHIDYYAVELYPLDAILAASLNYGGLAWREEAGRFNRLHDAGWDCPVSLSDRFTLHKIKGDARLCGFPRGINLVYFDAFAPGKQAGMWELPLFERLYDAMEEGGILVTYCAKGEVRRRMQSAGFNMQRLPGPPGKRHMLRGSK